VWLNLVWLVVLLPALWVGANTGGMRGAAAAHAVVALVVAIPLATVMLHRAGVDMRPVVRRFVRPVVAGVAAGVTMAAVALLFDLPLLQLVVAGGIGGVVYLLIAVPAHGRTAARTWTGSFVAARRGASA
jgi:PST family polysaccharide transporter